MAGTLLGCLLGCLEDEDENEGEEEDENEDEAMAGYGWNPIRLLIRLGLGRLSNQDMSTSIPFFLTCGGGIMV